MKETGAFTVTSVADPDVDDGVLVSSEYSALPSVDGSEEPGRDPNEDTAGSEVFSDFGTLVPDEDVPSAWEKMRADTSTSVVPEGSLNLDTAQNVMSIPGDGAVVSYTPSPSASNKKSEDAAVAIQGVARGRHGRARYASLQAKREADDRDLAEPAAMTAATTASANDEVSDLDDDDDDDEDDEIEEDNDLDGTADDGDASLLASVDDDGLDLTTDLPPRQSPPRGPRPVDSFRCVSCLLACHEVGRFSGVL